MKIKRSLRDAIYMHIVLSIVLAIMFAIGLSVYLHPEANPKAGNGGIVMLEEAAIQFSAGDKVGVNELQTIERVPNYAMDKDEEEHYDSVSALQKSVRGSDVNAALYYLARLCIAEDLDSIKRRLLVTAYEDVGLANPAAVQRCQMALEAAEQVGFPEAVIPLGFTVCELALSPKSKAACNASSIVR